MSNLKFDVELKEVAVKNIKPYSNNVRDNNEEAVKAVAESMERYGFQNPIVVDKDMVILAGHTRLLALKENGTKKVTVIVSQLEGDLAREYRAVDNRTSELSQWNEDNVRLELKEFVDQKYAQNLFGNLADNNTTQQTPNYGITDEEVKKKQQDMADHFSNKSDERNHEDKFVKIPCPHCERRFSMTKSDLLHKFRYEKLDREAQQQ